MTAASYTTSVDLTPEKAGHDRSFPEPGVPRQAG